MKRAKPQVFVIRLVATGPGVNAIQSLKAVLKSLLRRHGFRCVGVSEDSEAAR